MQTPQTGKLWQISAPARQTAAFWRVLYSRTLFCTKFRAVTLVSDRTGRSVAVNVETFGNVRALTDRFSLCYLYFTSVLWVRFKMLIGGTVPCAWWSACSATGFRCPGIASARTAKRVYERTPSSIKITARIRTRWCMRPLSAPDAADFSRWERRHAQRAIHSFHANTQPKT